MTPFDLLAVTLVAAAVIGCLNHSYVRLPPLLGLLLGSLLVTAVLLAADPLTDGQLRPWLHGVLEAVHLPHLFLDGVLGFLLFAATFQVSLDELRDQRWTILTLATASVVLSTVLFGFGLHWLCRLAGYDLPLAWCGVIGAILAPTDAVVVDDLLRRIRIPASLRNATAGESLLNDGAGVVLFVIALQLANGQTNLIGHGRVALAMLHAGGGGAVLGIAAGLLTRRVLASIRHVGLALTVSLALVMASYRLAAAFDLSGPITVVVAGLVLNGNPLRGGRDQELAGFWLLLYEVLNAILFLLIGLQAAELPYATLAWLPVLAAIPLAVLTRFVSTLVPLAFAGGSWRIQLRRTVALTWAGMRGGVSIAMVLATPDTPWRGELLAICLAVVLFTMFVQGLTLPWVLGRLFGTDRLPAVGRNDPV